LSGVFDKLESIIDTNQMMVDMLHNKNTYNTALYKFYYDKGKDLKNDREKIINTLVQLVRSCYYAFDDLLVKT